jgi:hypothetical protein
MEYVKDLASIKWTAYFKGLLVGVIIGGGLEALIIGFQIGAIR